MIKLEQHILQIQILMSEPEFFLAQDTVFILYTSAELHMTKTHLHSN